MKKQEDLNLSWFPVKNTSIKEDYIKNIDLYFLQSNLEKKF